MRSSELFLCGGDGVGGTGGIPSDYLVSTQLQLGLFCCWGCGCCWAVTIKEASAMLFKSSIFVKGWTFGIGI